MFFNDDPKCAEYTIKGKRELIVNLIGQNLSEKNKKKKLGGGGD